MEWGHGLAEDLSEDRLEVVLDVDPATEARTATVCGVGGRWSQAITDGARAAAGTAWEPFGAPRAAGPFEELGGQPC